MGSSFDDFLDEEGMLAEAEALAIKRVVAYRLDELMREKHLTKSKLANAMHTSRSSLDRLLDPDNSSVTLVTLEKAARALGMRLRVEFSA
jgi:DNA-binding Xre family transcriptional regulator